MTNGRIVWWKRELGEPINAGDSLRVIESDAAATDWHWKPIYHSNASPFFLLYGRTPNHSSWESYCYHPVTTQFLGEKTSVPHFHIDSFVPPVSLPKTGSSPHSSCQFESTGPLHLNTLVVAFDSVFYEILIQIRFIIFQMDRPIHFVLQVRPLDLL